MSRRRKATKRAILPDPLHGSPLISSLVNAVMFSGKKSLAQRIVYKSIEKMAEKVGKGNPIELVLGALENIRPKIEVKSRRVGGATYQVPIEVPFERQQSLAFRWVVNAASSRKGTPIADALANELIDAYNNTGSVVKKREETHKMAQANRAFAHLRW
ncbi:MAG: 30S ribosomal protein S7 [Opitutales bacterium]|jgi:small subunit ribosomal protein S7|nr:30S ribosomal protein S7 [Opitutae bacterium]MEC8243818.1 30S ribosomal protein S7 [Verrucomicrobiota bacterium]NBQ01965.1 30S ribosomal protein S7 [Opitutae bacterium]NBU86484.1 30S ribosomal protein S7 [Verrucomicrobiota bacterium]|tara:strand:- start:9986 stop:10459 length:474 start_codon:yes stop_codon:yes gene_type:complete